MKIGPSGAKMFHADTHRQTDRQDTMKLIVAFLNFTNSPKTIQEQTAFITNTQPGSFFRRVHKTAKSDYWLRRVCLSVRPSVLSHGTTRLPMDGFS